MEGENDLWYGRFERYRLSGPSRSILATYNAERRGKAREGEKERDANTFPSSWSLAVKAYRWKERASAWDNYQIEKDRREREEHFEMLRRQSKDDRIALFQAQQAVLAQQLNILAKKCRRGEAEEELVISPRILFNAIRMTAEQLRAELDQQPKQRHEVTGADGQSLVSVSADAVIEAARQVDEWEREMFGIGEEDSSGPIPSLPMEQTDDPI